MPVPSLCYACAMPVPSLCIVKPAEHPLVWLPCMVTLMTSSATKLTSAETTSPHHQMHLLHDDSSSYLPAGLPALVLSSVLSWVLQMSAAWAELDESTAAEPPSIDSIKAAIRQARPYEELKQQVRVAENFLASLERGLERQQAQERAESERQRKAPEARAADVPSPHLSPGRETASRAGAVPESPHHLEAAQQAEPNHQAQPAQQIFQSSQILDGPQMQSRERPSGQDSTAVQTTAAITQQPRAAVTEAEQQEKDACFVGMSKGVEAHEAAEEREAAEVQQVADVHRGDSEEERSEVASMPADAVGNPHPEEPTNDSSTTHSYTDR